MPLELHCMHKCLLWSWVLQLLMVMSTSFHWNHWPTSSSQFSSSVVRQFGAILTFKPTFSNLHGPLFRIPLDHGGNSDERGECSSLPPSPTLPSLASHPLNDTLYLPRAFSTELSNPNSILPSLCIYKVNISVKEREIFTLKYLIKLSFRGEWIGQSKHIY